MSAKSQSTRDLLCEAAIRTASRDGLLSMTLDNVAREAKVSKGGVMYHFPTKEQLVLAMVEHFGQRLERMILERVAVDPEPRNRWARAMIDLTFPAVARSNTKSVASGGEEAQPAVGAGRDDERSATSTSGLAGDLFCPEALDQFFLAMLAAAVTHPGVLVPLRAVGKRIQERLLGDPHAGLDQMLTWLVMDGLFLWQFVGLIDRDDPLFQRIGEELRRRVAADSSANVPAGTTPSKKTRTNTSAKRPAPAGKNPKSRSTPERRAR